MNEQRYLLTPFVGCASDLNTRFLLRDLDS